MYFVCTPTVKLKKTKNVTHVTVDFKILQHLNLSLFQCIDFFLSRNLKNYPSIFNLNHQDLPFHLVCYKEKNVTLALFYIQIYEKTTTLSQPLTPPKKY